jgi:DNA-binding NtrC family response regulator
MGNELPTDGRTEGLLHLLVVGDRESGHQRYLAERMTRGLRVSSVEDCNGALAMIEADAVDVVFTDVRTLGMSVLELLDHVKRISPRTKVVLMSEPSAVESMVQLLRLGACDVFKEPLGDDELSLVLERLARRFEPGKEEYGGPEPQQGGCPRLIGNSRPMLELFNMIAKASQSQFPVLIEGESGTGKELVARSIHEKGPRANKPFLPIDCGSLVPTLIESELFGHVRGAFTGAVCAKKGLLEAACGGTVFLDEIGEMPSGLQSKLLRALQEKEVRPVGSCYPIKIEARIIAATNRDLEMAVYQGHFRRDLYFRLNVLGMRIVPLRERKSDIPMLVTHMLEKCRPTGKAPLRISEEAMLHLLSYSWPGNVRELMNCIERATALASGPVVKSSDLPTSILGTQSTVHRAMAISIADDPPPFPGTEAGWRVQPSAMIDPCEQLPTIQNDSVSAEPREANNLDRVTPLHLLQKQAIFQALRIADGDKIRAANLLGIGKTTLYRKLAEYGLPKTQRVGVVAGGEVKASAG